MQQDPKNYWVVLGARVGQVHSIRYKHGSIRELQWEKCEEDGNGEHDLGMLVVWDGGSM